MKNKLRTQRGSMLITLLVFTSIFIIMAGGLLGMLTRQKKIHTIRKSKIAAIEIAEAGINYYKWHLDIFPNDFSDGNGSSLCNPNPPYTCGPYIHDYTDPSGSIIGRFELYITPPQINSTIVKIKSTGWPIEQPNIKRMLGVRYGRPSLARYAVIANTNLRFGTGTEIHGPLHSNGGIRFDGVAYNEITSAQNTYNDTDSDACTLNSWGVHTCVNPADPTPSVTPPNRPDVFKAGRRYPLPNIDFGSISTNLSKLQTDAKSNGLYINKSNKEGWHIQFLGNNLRYRKVRTTNTCTVWDNCTWSTKTASTGNISQYQDNWTTTNFPNNGIIFVEDNAWVDGTLNSGVYVTLVAAKEPLTTENAEVWINSDLRYAQKDGTTALGIIAQNNINIGLYSSDTLEVDAALLSQKGRVGRYYYPSGCSASYYKRSTINVYGVIGTNQRYGFSWICSGACSGWCSGYQTRNITFDSNLLYSPPPSYPMSGEYTLVSWEELVTGETF